MKYDDQDDEFESGFSEQTEIIDGFRFRELIETGSTNFVVTEAPEDIDYDALLRKNEKISVQTFDDPFFKLNSTITYPGRDRHGQVISEFDGDYNNFDNFSKVMENITEDGGLKKYIMQPGMGDDVRAGQIVYINYYVNVENMDTAVDNSNLHEVRGRKGEPYRLKVGAGEVIPVIDLGVATMQCGETAKFLAQPQYAYGKLGCLPRIPPNSRALVTIKVVEIVDGSVKLDIAHMTTRERQKLPFNELYKGVIELKRFGTDAYSNEEYSSAKRQYKSALGVAEDLLTPDDSENKMKLEMKYALFANIAQCSLKLERYTSAKAHCQMAIALPVRKPLKLKAYFRLAQAFHGLGNIEEAKKNVDIANSIGPNHEEIKTFLNMINDKILKDRMDEKELAVKLMSDMQMKE